VRLALLATILALGCGSKAAPDDTVPDDLEIEEGPWEDRDPHHQAAIEAVPPDAAPAAPQTAVKVQVVSDPSEAAARIDLAVRDAGVSDVLRMIATAANVSIVVSDDVTGNVTLDVDNVTWRQAIDVIAHLEGLTVTEVDGVVLVKNGP